MYYETREREITVNNETFTIVAYLDENDEVDFYDVFDDCGNCVNDGYPLYNDPTPNMIRNFLN